MLWRPFGSGVQQPSWLEVEVSDIWARAAPTIPSRDYFARMDKRKLLQRLERGAVSNVAFADLCSLAEGLGFELRRISGSHHVFAHPEVPELINLQAVRGQVKPYQVRQFLRLVERYDLSLRGKP